MHRRQAFLFSPALMLLSLWFLGDTAQAKVTQAGGAERNTVWTSVYRDAQAANGQAVYRTTCSGCHGDSLEGGTNNPPLKGEKFIENWREDNLDSLFTKIKRFMPKRDPGSLSDREYLDIVSYILQANGFPAGPNELSASVLRTIQIEGKDGPKPLPNRTVVQAVGCMTQGVGDAWMLTMALQPTRTRDPDTTTPEELKAAEAKPPGTLTFQLQNLEMLGAFNPESHKGHKMQAKGVLLKQPNGDRISLLSLEMLAPSCGQ